MAIVGPELLARQWTGSEVTKQKVDRRHPHCLGISVIGRRRLPSVSPTFFTCVRYIKEKKKEVDVLGQDCGESKMQW